MNLSKELEKIGIIPKDKLKIEEKNYIAKTIADKLSTNIYELCDSYNEIYMRIFNCEMYYASVDKKFYGVFYFYKNNTIYIDSIKNIYNVDSYMIHEAIHYLQNFSKIKDESKRAGLCQFMDFKISGLGINEAIVQYITAKAEENKIHRISNENITICTNSDYYYKYMTSLASQILFLMGEKEAIESCINSTDNFENELYNTFEENTEKILKGFDTILDENNKYDRSEEKIINTYLQTQELIYKAYFSNMCKRVETIKEVDAQVQKLEDYKKIVGKLLNISTDEDKFNAFKKEMDSKFFNKYIQINRKQSKNSLTVVYKNLAYNLWNKIYEFIQRKIIKIK